VGIGITVQAWINMQEGMVGFLAGAGLVDKFVNVQCSEKAVVSLESSSMSV